MNGILKRCKWKSNEIGRMNLRYVLLVNFELTFAYYWYFILKFVNVVT